MSLVTSDVAAIHFGKSGQREKRQQLRKAKGQRVRIFGKIVDRAELQQNLGQARSEHGGVEGKIEEEESFMEDRKT